MKRTNFNYVTASVSEIAEYFKLCTSQCISATRSRYKNNTDLREKVEEAYKQYKINKIVSG